jgi:deazaflavin-dependent oxidoreductase (nitroreductase family)
VALDPDLARRSVCQLETTGRVTALPRVVEMWFAADPDRDRIYLLSGGRDRAHWVRNIRREPAVRVAIGRHQFAGRAFEVDDPADDALARHLLAAKYQGWTPGAELSGWAQGSLPVAIDLMDPAPAAGNASSCPRR